ncbi:PAS domain-containing protein [Bradyrhizobium sp. GM6.1]
MLIAGTPIATVLLASGDGIMISLGINLLLLLVLLGRMINTNFRSFVQLIQAHSSLIQEGERARAAEQTATALAERFDRALNNMSQGLCFFDDDQRLIVCNRKYLEIYDLDPEAVRPGMKLNDIVDLRYSAGSAPKISKEEYLVWRNSDPVIAPKLRYDRRADEWTDCAHPAPPHRGQRLGCHARGYHGTASNRDGSCPSLGCGRTGRSCRPRRSLPSHRGA